MAIKLSSIKADPVRETEGDWQDIPDLPGLRLKVRSLEFTQYRVARDLLTQKLIRKYGRKPIPPDVQTKEFGRLYADHILLDWEGIADDVGASIPYSRDAAHEYLSDPDFRKLTAAVEWAAQQVGESEIEFLEEAAKNSETPSATI